MVPFSPSWDPEKQEQVKLDEESIVYIQKMSKIFHERSKFKTFIFFPIPTAKDGAYPFFTSIRS
jgi:hypothetical protein